MSKPEQTARSAAGAKITHIIRSHLWIAPLREERLTLLHVASAELDQVEDEALNGGSDKKRRGGEDGLFPPVWALWPRRLVSSMTRSLPDA